MCAPMSYAHIFPRGRVLGRLFEITYFGACLTYPSLEMNRDPEVSTYGEMEGRM